MATSKKKNLQNYVLPPPEQVEVTSGLPTLVAGIVVDLIWCTGENGPSSPEIFHALLLLPQRLEPWLGILDASVAEKQGDSLFRGLYKCASVVVANPSLYGAELVQRFSMLTIQHCASSTLWEQYAKVFYVTPASQLHTWGRFPTSHTLLQSAVAQLLCDFDHHFCNIWQRQGVFLCHTKACLFKEGSVIT